MKRLLKHKTRPNDVGVKRAKYVSALDTLFDIGAPVAIENIMSSRFLSTSKKNEDIYVSIMISKQLGKPL
jgi:hypothetical protein